MQTVAELLDAFAALIWAAISRARSIFLSNYFTSLRPIVARAGREDNKEVNRMDKPLGKSSGEITIDVHLNGLDEQLAKAHELVDTIKKARSLADDLAKGINSIELEL